LSQANKYSNTIAFSGTYSGSDTVSSSYTIREEHIEAGSSGWNGSITVTKVDADNNVISSEAEFELLDSMKNVKATLSTNSDGQAVFPRLKLRTYYIREKTAPLGYALDTTEYEITLVGGEDPATRNRTISITNELLVANISMQKTGADDEPLSGGSFAIYDAADTGFTTPLQTKPADNGLVEFTGLLPGDYKIRELAAPIGYKLSGVVVDVSLVLDEENNMLDDVVIDEPFINVLQTADISLQKTDIEGEPLSGGSFAIYDAADTDFITPLQTVAANEGLVEFTSLLPGDYKIRELIAPIGYVLSNAVIDAPLVLNESANLLSDLIIAEPFVNELLVADISLQKTDSEGEPLSGGSFAIYDAADTDFTTPLQTVTANDGLVEFTNLLPGDYKIRELTAPVGYALSDVIVDVSLVLDEENNVLEDIAIDEPLVNEHIIGSIELLKVGRNNAPLAGAKFGLYDLDKNLLDTVISNDDGIVLFEQVPYGEYIIEEISSPDGYIRSDETINVSVEDFGVTQTSPYTFVNRPDDRLPQTGSFWDSTTLLTLGALLILGGVLLFFRPAFKKKNR
jgi:uncharacterized surface anchored protein